MATLSSPPALLAVSRSLPAGLQALPHVPDLVSSFLLPPTIDSAAFNGLQRVLRVFEDSRPYTVAAMDGAATRGLLDIVQWLHSNQPEGCSSAAFMGAASNNHLHVLEWMYDFYPQRANSGEDIVAAAGNGHVPVVEFLLLRVRGELLQLAMEAAARNGHIPALEVLLRRPYNIGRTFLAAAGNGRAEVVQFLLGRGVSDRYGCVNPALLKAAAGGYYDVVELLLELSDAFTTSDALTAAAENGHASVVRLILNRCEFSKVEVTRALEKAAKKDQSDVVKMLLEKLTRESCNQPGGQGRRSVNSMIEIALLDAVECGRINIVKLLVEEVPLTVSDSLPIGDVLLAAASHNQLAVMEFLLEFCEERHITGPSFKEGVTSAIESAVSSGLLEMTGILAGKCAAVGTGNALQMAVRTNNLKMLERLVKKSNSSSVGDAVVAAAVADRMEMLDILLANSSTDVVEQALIRVASVGKDKMSALLLGKCNRQSYSRIFENAAGHGLVGLVQFLLDKMDTPSIRCGLISAAISGHTDVVSVLLDGSDSCGIRCAFEMAVLKGHLDVVKLLREHCDADSLRFAISAGDPDVVHLFRNKRARLE